MTYVEGVPSAPGEMRDPEAEAAAATAAAAARTPEAAPSPTQQRTLGELVPEDVLGPITETLNSAIDGRMSPRDASRMIVQILDPYREYVETKGAIPEFLAAYLVAAHTGREVRPEEPPQGRIS